jgi:hypothetical protein
MDRRCRYAGAGSPSYSRPSRGARAVGTTFANTRLSPGQRRLLVIEVVLHPDAERRPELKAIPARIDKMLVPGGSWGARVDCGTGVSPPRGVSPVCRKALPA